MFSDEFTFQCWKLFIFRITNLLKLNLININTGLWQSVLEEVVTTLSKYSTNLN